MSGFNSLQTLWRTGLGILIWSSLVQTHTIYWQDFVKPNSSDSADSQNYSNTFHGIRCKTFGYMNSFFPDAISSWNNAISNFQNVPWYIKTYITSLIRREKKNILWHSCVGYLFQHKKRHNFVGTPSNECPCNFGIEDKKHFLFLCPFYEA